MKMTISVIQGTSTDLCSAQLLELASGFFRVQNFCIGITIAANFRHDDEKRETILRMINIKAVEFVGETMQALGCLFITVRCWAPAWGLEKVIGLGLEDPAGRWVHLVRDGLLLLVAGSALHILAEFF